MDTESSTAQPRTEASVVPAIVAGIGMVLVTVGVGYELAYIDYALTMAGFFYYLVIAPATFVAAIVTLLAAAMLPRGSALKFVGVAYGLGAMTLTVSLYFLGYPAVRGW